MASYVMSLVQGSSIAFNPVSDILAIDLGGAADLEISAAGSSLVLAIGDASVTLLNTSRGRLSTANVTFADGSQLLIGDTLAGTASDNLANVLAGGAGADQLIGLGGNDTLDGGDAGDRYTVIGTGDGYDTYSDTGTSGVDRIVAGADGTRIGLASGFSAASGIEEIMAAGHSGVSLAGGGTADRFDFSAVTLSGITVIDGGSGNDTVIGSAGADSILGGAGNDSLDGGDAGDTYLVGGTGQGSDVFHDTGSTGIDRILATSAGTVIRPLGGFSQAVTGIEEISGNGFANVSVAGSSAAERLDFSAVTLTGIALVDGGSGNDTVIGTAAGDILQGGAGNDSLDGADGGDTYRVGIGHGADLIRDTGASGVDRVVAVAANTKIGVLGDFSAAVSGIEEISAGGFANVTLLGDSTSEILDFSAVALTGVALLDGGSGNDTMMGTAAGDVLQGSAGNDSLDGADGGDTYRVGVSHGADLFRDTGVSGIDRVVATAAGTKIGVLGDFSAATSGIEEISAGGYSNVRLLGDGVANTLDLSAVALDGVLIDGGGGNDTIIGGVGADTIQGGSGNDSQDGGDGSDSYLVFGTGSGTDRFQDTGAVGSDVILAGSAGTQIRSAGGFSLAATGVEAISGNGFANVSVLGASTADAFDFTGVTLNDIARIDAGAGNDSIVGSAGADTIRGGGGNDSIEGGAGSDVVEFAGMQATYQVTRVGGQTVVKDLATGVNGNDGTDTLQGVEILRFLDGDLLLDTPPVAMADSAAALEDGGPVAIDVLANDTDADIGDTKTVVSIDTTGLQGVAAIDVGGTGVSYSVGGAFQGLKAGETTAETFAYTIQDGAGGQSTASVTVTVMGVNDGPQAVGDTTMVSADAAAVMIDVLVNDTDADIGDSKTIVAIDATAALGSVALAADGSSVSYAAAGAFDSLGAGQMANDNFAYVIADAAGAQSTAYVDVTIVGVNDGPVAVADSIAGLSTDVFTIDVLANDYDVDAGDVLTLIGASVAPGQGTVSVVGNQLVFDPGSDFAGLAAGSAVDVVASYIAQDAAGAVSTADVTLTLTAPGTGPVDPPTGTFTVIDPAQAAAQAGVITGAILAATPGITVDTGSFAMVAGASSAMFYDGGLTSLGIGPGLLLTSGTVPGISNTAGYFGQDNGMPGDPVLDAVVNTVFSTVSYDASSISFSFSVTDPTVTGIQFNAVFGSDEYPEWVDAFVDIGVVLVNGINVAYFNNDPMAPLSVIGSNLSADYFNDNTANLDTSSFGGVAIPGVASTYPIEYDGISNLLTIRAPVHLGQNTITIAIADTGDHIYDSGLFISNLRSSDLPGSGVVIEVSCTEGNDDKSGSDASELFDGLGGDDSIAGNGGNDVVLGGVGDDSLDGGADDDVLQGGDDSDLLTGGAGDDQIDGGNGIDTAVFSGDSADYQIQQIGDGQYVVAQIAGVPLDGSDIVSAVEYVQFVNGVFDLSTLVDPAPATDGATIQGTAEDDIIDAVTTVLGQDFATDLADLVHAGEGDDIIATGDGADVIHGEAGRDEIDAGAGNDQITGGLDRDDLFGGAGADRFIFEFLSDSTADAAARDKILDFNSADGDRIDLHFLDAIAGTPENDAFTLSAEFTGTAGELIIINASLDSGLLVEADIDGDAVADFGILVEEVAALNLTDFWL